MNNDKSYFEIEEVQGKLFPVVSRKKGEVRIEECPFCGKTHEHALGSGHRFSHCRDTAGYFDKIIIKGHELLQRDGYIIHDID